MYLATCVEPTNEIAADLRMRQQRVDAFAVAVHDVEHALRQAGLHQQLAQPNAESGTFSDGFSTNVLPQVSATGNIHSGTMNGKLNGVMPTQTPTGWRTGFGIDVAWRCSAASAPMIRLGMPQANSTTSMPRCTSARASAERLAVLARDQRGQFLEVLFQAARGSGT